ncbi:glucosamine-6-phosphate deaminase [Evansella cellulosilytica]|uniref:Glucosamine-6-phosphate deaminase n=1 Tax=Evansella cellulosilytica (strain ATCC 21833 / DSM 2522 / FERM P-1141 / JCM 9156 / N-4) TaxID=649639 RepID=E6TT28_EVAC2|nr:glucosamine-6-phosphate deaminase [Evansella cellulosilytica]ADU31936.1 glucosamine-6-phosphate isomerase [Evansella cellulosilytica DSM 2522]
MELVTVSDYEQMSKNVCQQIVDKVNILKTPVLGLATGGTPELLYERLIDEYKSKNVSFANTFTFNLDEYVGLSGDHPNSYRHYMNEKLLKHVDISIHQTHIPNGMAENLEEECANYEALIEKAGGIDIQILGLGMNGHIGFNEPGTSFHSKTHVVTLDSSTRQANARFFPNAAEVPHKAITMGINTILSSKKIILMVSGEKKASALNRLLNGEVSPEFPASVLLEHPNVTVVADHSALSLL